MLFELYEKSNKYPSKEEMSDLAKIIGVLPIKILWWFTHRRRMDKKKGGDFTEKSSPANKKSPMDEKERFQKEFDESPHFPRDKSKYTDAGGKKIFLRPKNVI